MYGQKEIEGSNNTLKPPEVIINEILRDVGIFFDADVFKKPNQFNFIKRSVVEVMHSYNATTYMHFPIGSEPINVVYLSLKCSRKCRPRQD